MGKMQLRPLITSKQRPALKLKSLAQIQKTAGKFYASGYAFTDNISFALFGIEEKVLLDNFIQEGILGFNFTEEMVDMKIDRHTQLIGMPLDADTVSFGNFGTVKKWIADLIFRIAPKATVYPVTEWFGEPVNALACFLENGKLVAVVKTL
jgi:hypothetical protein